MTSRWKSSCLVIQLILSMLPLKVHVWFAKGIYSTATKPMGTDQGEPSPHLVRRSNLLWQQKRTQLPILTIDFATDNRTQTLRNFFVLILTLTPQARNRLYPFVSLCRNLYLMYAVLLRRADWTVLSTSISSLQLDYDVMPRNPWEHGCHARASTQTSQQGKQCNFN